MENNDGGQSLLQRKMDETMELVDAASFMLYNNTAISRDEFLSHLDRFKQLEREDAAMNTDELGDEVRESLCARAISVIFGQSFEFTKNGVGRSLYYRYSQYQKNKYLISLGILWFTKVVEAFQCSTAPNVYIHITELFETSEYLAQVIIVQKDLTQSLAQRKR